MKAYLTLSEKSITTRNTKFVACNQSNTESEQGKRSSYHGQGWMEGKKILEKVSAIREDKAKKEQAKKERKCQQNSKLRHSLNVRKNTHVARMLVLQPIF